MQVLISERVITVKLERVIKELEREIIEQKVILVTQYAKQTNSTSDAPMRTIAPPNN